MYANTESAPVETDAQDEQPPELPDVIIEIYDILLSR